MEALVGVHDGLQLQGRQLAPLDTVLHQTYAIVNTRQSWQHVHRHALPQPAAGCASGDACCVRMRG